MMATNGSLPAAGSDWALEPKLDGWRAIAYIADGQLDVRTRQGRSITISVPEIEGLREATDGQSAVLDGEIVAGQGRPSDFYRLGPRLAATRPVTLRRQQRITPITFAIFDVLYLGTTDLRGEPYRFRRTVLESLHLSSPHWCTVASYDADDGQLLQSCADLDLEGIVAKRRSSNYRSGDRSRDWIKVKTAAWREVHAPLRHEHHPTQSSQATSSPGGT
jgi:bifunctional non-homologous end joining protein LigD